MSKAAMFRTMLNVQNVFDDVRLMNKFELKSFIRENRSIQQIIMKGNYSEKQRLLSSQVIYAKNRLRLM
tara:strand:- start:1198 stop:1404 length:207 start_codon:yes stop_codon:yes gene_type:complete